jgi:hypothetical protein
MVDGNGATKKVIKVLVGIPNEGHTDSEAYDNRLEMFMHLGILQTLSHFGHKEYCGVKYDIPDGVEYEFSLGVIGEVFPAYAREQLATIAVDNGFDYLFMIDDDMLSPYNLFEQLIKHDVDIIAPLAFTRTSPHKPVIYNLEQGYDHVMKKDYYVNYIVERYPKDQLVECDAVGFGAVLIKCDVLRKMKKPWMMTTSGAGEDIHFCHSAGKAGFKIFMDTSVKLGHLGYRKKITEMTYENESKVVEDRKEMGDINKYGDFNTFIGRSRDIERAIIEGK